MKNIINLFKTRLNILFCLVFILLFTSVLTANEPATKPTKQEFAQKTAKLHMPFIANNGQMGGQVKFYAKTFGGTVFVTKKGEIVYALPINSSELGVQDSECRGEWHSPNGIHEEAGTLHNHHISDIVHPASWIVDHDKTEFRNPKSAIKDDAVCHPECNEGSLVLKRDSSPLAQNDREESEFQNLKSTLKGIALREEFVGSRVKAIQGEQPSVTKVSYFKGNDPSKWKTNISTYDAVNLGEIYDGIELKLRAYGNNVEKLFCVKPGADPEQIKIRLSGLKGCGVQNVEITHPLVPSREEINPKSEFQNSKLQINKSGELVAETELGLVKFTKPVAYQEVDGKRVEVDVVYNISNPKSQTCGERSRTIRNPKLEYGFKVASYDRTKDLIIDPLLASTYLGGYEFEYGYGIGLDTSGNVYVTGWTYSTDFPTTSGAYDTSYNVDKDVFVSKLDSGLTSLLASTYLGGPSSDAVYAIGIDTSGNVYVTGYTGSKNFPTTSGAYDTSFNGDYYVDVFVSKLDSGLTSLLASTFLGGSVQEYGYSIALDSSGDVYVTGWTNSTNFPITSGAYDTSHNDSSSYYRDVFISKLNSELSSLLASTFLGGPNDVDYGYSIALDSSGNVYVTGWTASTNFPTTSGAYDTSSNGSDTFVSKLDSKLASLLASTYLGGSDKDYGNSLTLDKSGNVYVTGYTQSTNFPTTSDAYDTSFNGGIRDIFVSKLDSWLTSLLASTFLGGLSEDYGESLAFDTSGNVYVTGWTNSTNFPIISGAYDTSFNSDYDEDDVFISKLNSRLTRLLASTYLGGSDVDDGYAISIDTSGNVYVTGWTSSTNFPTTSETYGTSYNGGSFDIFVSKLDGNLSATPCVGDITGQVTDAKTGNPIVGASIVYGVGTSRQDFDEIDETETDTLGNYEFLGVECGDYVVVTSANGYKRSRRTNIAQVSVGGGAQEQINFELQPRRDSK